MKTSKVVIIADLGNGDDFNMWDYLNNELGNHAIHSEITESNVAANVVRASGDMMEALRKYERWCSDDVIRQKYASPAQVRDMILADIRSTIASIERK